MRRIDLVALKPETSGMVRSIKIMSKLGAAPPSPKSASPNAAIAFWPPFTDVTFALDIPHFLTNISSILRLMILSSTSKKRGYSMLCVSDTLPGSDDVALPSLLAEGGGDIERPGAASEFLRTESIPTSKFVLFSLADGRSTVFS
jgi:hypothetical protein